MSKEHGSLIGEEVISKLTIDNDIWPIDLQID